MIKIVTLASPLADTGEYGETAMRFRDVIDKFHNQNRFADTCTAEQTDLAALHIRREQIDNFNAGDENFRLSCLIGK